MDDGTNFQLEKPTADFTMVCNALLRDKSISLRAKGLYGLMFSKPDGWIFHEAALLTESTEGRDALRAAMRELLVRGWVQKCRPRQGGMFVGTIYRMMLTTDWKTVDGLTGDGKSTTSNTDLIKTDTVSPSVSPQSTKVPKRGSTPLTSIAVLLEDLTEIPDELRRRAGVLANIDDEWARFRNHHISMRSKHTRLDLCWDTWCRNATKFAARSSAPRSAATGQGGTGSRDVMASAKRAALAELTGQCPEGLRGQAAFTDCPTGDHTRAAGGPQAIGMGAGANHQTQPGQHAGADGSHSNAADRAQMEDIWGRGERQDEPQGMV